MNVKSGKLLNNEGKNILNLEKAENQQQEKKKSDKISILFYPPVAALLMYALVYLGIEGENPLYGIVRYPLFFIISIVVIGVLMMFLYGIFDKKWIVFPIMNVLILFFSIANRIKQSVRGEGFTVHDFRVLGEGAEVADALSKRFITWTIFWGVLVLIVLFALTFFLKGITLRQQHESW